ncbi:MAG TPA: c-type cytochrome [Candidatus Binatia bacterium]|nr:c-type cytochrome [Candidatus Binatia bacterium]
MRRFLSSLSLAASLVASASLAATPAPDVGTDAQREAGKKLYEVNCAQCHGEKGDGDGIAAPFLLPKPRDFTSGKFKIRTTPSGALPTTEDLKKIIRAGMPYTAMPAWPQFNEQQLTDVVYYVKSFDAAFANAERQPEPIEISAAPSLSKDSVEKGKKLYADLGCARCHGELGRTDGISAPTLKDDWGNTIRAADLTRRWTFRGGPKREDIFRAFSTGLNGTPMPSFVDALSVEQRWDLANYVYSLSESDAPNYATVVVAKKVQKEIDPVDATLFEDAEAAYFPVIGQIMQPGREFHPPCDGLSVRAVYNETDLAFELRWNDMRAETSGKNTPEIAVPAAEDEGEKLAAKPAAEGGGSVWGEEEQAAPAAKPAEPAKSEGSVWGEEEAGAAAPAAPASEFSDAVAIQLPVAIPTTIRKPYFIFGDKGNPVNLWFADLAKKQANLYLAQGSDGLEALGPRKLDVASHYDKGEWRVVFKRPLRSQGEVGFEEGAFIPVAFSVWDGGSRERGNKRALTNWWTVYLSPAEKRSPAGQMAKWSAAAFALELVFVGWARRRARRSTGAT